jgi:Transposase
MAVIIGVDPHKATHTAVAIDRSEAELARARVRATRKQVPQLLRWAEPLGKRTWAVESAGGLGYLLSLTQHGARLFVIAFGCMVVGWHCSPAPESTARTTALIVGAVIDVVGALLPWVEEVGGSLLSVRTRQPAPAGCRQRRTSSRAALARRITWKWSTTRRASGRPAATAVA